MKKVRKIISLLLCFALILQQAGFAQVAGALDISAHFARLSNSFVQDKFRPLHLRYLQYLPQENNFKLLLDKGDEFLNEGRVPHPSSFIPRNDTKLKEASQKLMQYFVIGITLPNEAFWVNLRPDAEDNIIDNSLAQTDVGKILLEADLQLKKDTARFTSPETPEGKEYWDKLYKKAEELYGSENITIPTLTRPWIVPGEIIIRETKDEGRGTTPSAYIYKATLKVMLESDYLKSTGDRAQGIGLRQYEFKDERSKALNEYSSQLIRELIIPKLTKEINTSKRYSPLRQVYYSLILAQWFKQRFYGKGGLYSWLINKQDLSGLTSKESWSKTTYFKAYQASFKNGEYNIQQPVSNPAGQAIRSYFSGGFICNLPNWTQSTRGTFSPVQNGPTTIIPVSGNEKDKPLLGADKAVSMNAYGGSVGSPVVTNINLEEAPSSPVYQPEPTESGASLKPIPVEANDVTSSPIGGPIENNINLPLTLGDLDNPSVYQGIVNAYNEAMKGTEAILRALWKQKGLNYELDVSIGAQAAVKLKVFELLVKGVNKLKIVSNIVENFLPSLKEEEFGILLPVGTEVEIWRSRPYTDRNYYKADVARNIWHNVLGLPLGRDELIEFALPPSRSSLTQVAMINSMVAIGLVPKGWFSLHISGALPIKVGNEYLLNSLPSYLELTKAILYTNSERLQYFTKFGWKPLDIKGGSGNISKVNGKDPEFIIYNGEEGLTRLEYRSGDVVVPGNSYQQAIPFIQLSHGLMYLALLAAHDPDKIENGFRQALLVIFDKFISNIDNWRNTKIPEEYQQLSDLFKQGLFKSAPATLLTITTFREQYPEAIEDLKEIVNNMQEELNLVFKDAQNLVAQPADNEVVANLEVVKRLKKVIPGKIDWGSIITSGLRSRLFEEVPRRLSIGDNYRVNFNDLYRAFDFTPPSLQELNILPINLQDLNVRLSDEFGLDQNLMNNLRHAEIQSFPEIIKLDSNKLFLQRNLWERILWRLGIGRSAEKRAFDRAIGANERAYRSNGADIHDIITRQSIRNAALRDAANELGSTPEELEQRISWEERQFQLLTPRNNTMLFPSDINSNSNTIPDVGNPTSQEPSTSSPAKAEQPASLAPSKAEGSAMGKESEIVSLPTKVSSSPMFKRILSKLLPGSASSKAVGYIKDLLPSLITYYGLERLGAMIRISPDQRSCQIELKNIKKTDESKIIIEISVGNKEVTISMDLTHQGSRYGGDLETKTYTIPIDSSEFHKTQQQIRQGLKQAIKKSLAYNSEYLLLDRIDSIPRPLFLRAVKLMARIAEALRFQILEKTHGLSFLTQPIFWQNAGIKNINDVELLTDLFEDIVGQFETNLQWTFLTGEFWKHNTIYEEYASRGDIILRVMLEYLISDISLNSSLAPQASEKKAYEMMSFHRDIYSLLNYRPASLSTKGSEGMRRALKIADSLRKLMSSGTENWKDKLTANPRKNAALIRSIAKNRAFTGKEFLNIYANLRLKALWFASQYGYSFINEFNILEFIIYSIEKPEGIILAGSGDNNAILALEMFAHKIGSAGQVSLSRNINELKNTLGIDPKMELTEENLKRIFREKIRPIHPDGKKAEIERRADERGLQGKERHEFIAKEFRSYGHDFDKIYRAYKELEALLFQKNSDDGNTSGQTAGSPVQTGSASSAVENTITFGNARGRLWEILGNKPIAEELISGRWNAQELSPGLREARDWDSLTEAANKLQVFMKGQETSLKELEKLNEEKRLKGEAILDVEIKSLGLKILTAKNILTELEEFIEDVNRMRVRKAESAAGTPAVGKPASLAPSKVAGSAVEKDVGGIDFRAMPGVIQPVNPAMVKLSAADLNRLQKVNLGSEWAEIQNMLNAGIIPSNERLKEYFLASCLSGYLSQEMGRALGCIANIMRMEEDRVSATDNELKNMLVLLESGRQGGELLPGLYNITCSPQEPQTAR